MRHLYLYLMLLIPLAAPAADEGRFSYLEQEVRNLQRQVQAHERRIDELSRAARPGAGAGRPASPAAPAASLAWVDAGKWRGLRPGMSELEVVGLLGPPTSMRTEDGARILFYALEIGSSGFFGGSVQFRERVVSEVQAPVLQ